MTTTAAFWAKRLIEILVVLSAAALVLVLLGGGFTLRVGRFKFFMEEPQNPAILLVLFVALRAFFVVGIDRLTRILPRAVELGILLIVGLAPFYRLRVVWEAVALVTTVLFLFDWTVTRRSPLRRVPMLWPLLALTSISLLSALRSPLGSYALLTFFRGPGLYLALFIAGTEHFRDERRLRWLLLVAVGSLFAVLLFGFARLALGFDDRFAAPLDWHTRAGMYFGLTLPILAGALFGTHSSGARITFGTLLVAGLLALLMTWSRGSWVAVGVSAIVFAVLVDRRLLLAFAACGAIVWVALPAHYRSRAVSVFEVSRYFESSTEAPLGNRPLAWRCALEMAAERPLLGAGLGFRHFEEAFKSKDYAIQAGEEIPHAHNVYLEILAETGILGLAAFLWVVVSLTALAARLYRKSNDVWTRRFAAGAVAALIGLWIYGLTDHFYCSPPGEASVLIWALAIVLVGLDGIESQRRSAAATVSLPTPVPQAAPITG